MKNHTWLGIRIDNGQAIKGQLIQCEITGKLYIIPKGSDLNESQKVGEEGCLRIVSHKVYENSLTLEITEYSHFQPAMLGKMQNEKRKQYERFILGIWVTDEHYVIKTDSSFEFLNESEKLIKIGAKRQNIIWLKSSEFKRRMNDKAPPSEKIHGLKLKTHQLIGDWTTEEIKYLVAWGRIID